MKYVMLAVVGTIGAVALFTTAGAFLWAISEELEDIRDLLRIALAEFIRVQAADRISRLETGVLLLECQSPLSPSELPEIAGPNPSA